MDKMWGSTDVKSEKHKLEKIKLFDDGNYGMFIHWGLYSHLGGKWKGETYYGIGEWIMNPRMAGIPVDDYKSIASEFNPVEFDGKKIAGLAKAAGMKYIIITSKHHDGFAMFDSDHPFNIVESTPFGRDPMKELSAACHELGLGFGFYYSHNQDWTEPGGNGGPKKFPDGSPAGFDDYFKNKCKPQVLEICSNYGEIDFVWFDTPGKMPKKYVKELVEIVKKLQPDAMLCSRVGHGMGDYVSKGDMEVPPRNIDGLWETADTNNDSWSYAWYDNNFKSPDIILHRLINTVARGGTYLFNVGPNGKGSVPETGQQFLREAGEWIEKYPQVIYGAGASPWGHELAWGDVTSQGNSLFLSVFEWPEQGQLFLPGLHSEIVSAEIPGRGPVDFRKDKGWTILDLACEPADHPVSVIELKLITDAEKARVDTIHGIYPNIQTTLLSEFAEVKNARKFEKKWMEKFGEWKHVNQISDWKKEGTAEWEVDVYREGLYYFKVKCAGEGPLVWKVTTDEGVMIQNQQPSTSQYQYYDIGILSFKNPGKHKISVSLLKGEASTSSLSAIIIDPVDNKLK